MTIQPAPGTESKINVTVDDSKFHMHDLADNKNLAHSMKMDPVMIFEPDVDGDFLLGIGDSLVQGFKINLGKFFIPKTLFRIFLSLSST